MGLTATLLFVALMIESLPRDILPGQTITFTDGWSVASVGDITFQIRIDGLAGCTIYFTR